MIEMSKIDEGKKLWLNACCPPQYKYEDGIKHHIFKHNNNNLMTADYKGMGKLRKQVMKSH